MGMSFDNRFELKSSYDGAWGWGTLVDCGHFLQFIGNLLEIFLITWSFFYKKLEIFGNHLKISLNLLWIFVEIIFDNLRKSFGNQFNDFIKIHLKFYRIIRKLLAIFEIFEFFGNQLEIIWSSIWNYLEILNLEIILE